MTTLVFIITDTKKLLGIKMQTYKNLFLTHNCMKFVKLWKFKTQLLLCVQFNPLISWLFFEIPTSTNTKLSHCWVKNRILILRLDLTNCYGVIGSDWVCRVISPFGDLGHRRIHAVMPAMLVVFFEILQFQKENVNRCNKVFCQTRRENKRRS